MTTKTEPIFSDPYTQQRILRGEEVYRLVGLHEATVWRLRRKGQFPQPIRLGGNSIGWPEQEIKDWLASRPRVR